mmetsp:Transcript_23371/g.55324  ORF Transcript_23371/g.55324 Transcript_23371/m.55324 type:complete len:200 (+) Transcript_23371:960-1559(+)
MVPSAPKYDPARRRQNRAWWSECSLWYSATSQYTDDSSSGIVPSPQPSSPQGSARTSFRSSTCTHRRDGSHSDRRFQSELYTSCRNRLLFPRTLEPDGLVLEITVFPRSNTVLGWPHTSPGVHSMRTGGAVLLPMSLLLSCTSMASPSRAWMLPSMAIQAGPFTSPLSTLRDAESDDEAEHCSYSSHNLMTERIVRRGA